MAALVDRSAQHFRIFNFGLMYVLCIAIYLTLFRQYRYSNVDILIVMVQLTASQKLICHHI